MQEKDTVVFITECKSASEKLVADELNKDASFLGVIVPVGKLTPFGKVVRSKSLRFLKRYVWKPITDVLHKLIPAVKPVETPVFYNALSKKRVHNMLFRYSPKAIAVSDANTLYAMKEILGKTAQSADLYVFADNVGLNYDLADKDVKHFFVDNIGVREGLVRRGVFTENVTVEPLPVKQKYFTERAQKESKRNLGFNDKTMLTVLCLNKKNYRKILDFAAANKQFTQYAVLTDVADIQVYAENKKIVSFDKSVHNEEIFNAADVVVSAFDGYLIKRVAARGKGTFVFGDPGKEREMVRLLEAGKHVLCVPDTEALGEALMRTFNGEIKLVPMETDRRSAERIAEEMKTLLTKKVATEE